jgi:lipopolysaccharide transport system permease protein
MKRLYDARDLLIAWTSRSLRARYQQSALGWLWAIIQPAAQVAIFAVIFTLFVPVDTGGTPYIIFSYVAMAPWAFLSASLPDMSNSIVGNMSLVTKIYFPREVLPIASMLARLIDFGVAGSLLIILILFFHVPILFTGLLLLPVVLLIQMVLIAGLGLALAGANVFYRDVSSLLSLVIQLWFYASPIIYPVSLVPERLRIFYFLNPMAGILEAYRDVLIYARLPGSYLIISAGVSFAILLIGYWFFKKVEFQFADIV